MKVSVIFGTRPEAIKLAPVIISLRARKHFVCHVCATAQHREMLDQVLSVFDILLDTDLNLMRPGQTLPDLTSRAVEALDLYFAQEKPDLVLFQGDTTTVLAGSLAAFYRGIPVGHVEAGLRTWNMQSPWPEEANRVLTTRLATLHFAPTETNRQNLIAEGVAPDRILVTGNTVIDSLFLALAKLRIKSPMIEGLDPTIMTGDRSVPVVLITGHRRENFGQKLEAVCEAIADLARLFPKTQFVYPVHMNPAVRHAVGKVLGGLIGGRQLPRNIHLINPVTYLQFVALMERCTIIVTDSGGIQEEAPSLGKPVLITRDTTERPEALIAGCAKLVGTHKQTIVDEVARLLTDRVYYEAAVKHGNPYGDGKAASRIVQAIVEYARSNPPSSSAQRIGPLMSGSGSVR